MYPIINIIFLILIIIILVTAFVFISKIVNQTLSENNPLKMHIATVPHSIKCLIKYPNCDNNDIDGWTLMQGLIFFIVGFMIPNTYLAALIVAILLAIVKRYFGEKPKFIINPLISMAGYTLGSFLHNQLYAPNKIDV